jgi:hypothetical protein
MLQILSTGFQFFTETLNPINGPFWFNPSVNLSR